ncbi:hypothetical protein [Pseudomonas syringae group genomosp. 7]|uniref:hypothetical protein n=1 Tax=Pseudomonas syringae group genomosp. 7 TaxID=251699 RepID=UPI00376F9DF2
MLSRGAVDVGFWGGVVCVVGCWGGGFGVFAVGFVGCGFGFVGGVCVFVFLGVFVVCVCVLFVLWGVLAFVAFGGSKFVFVIALGGDVIEV